MFIDGIENKFVMDKLRGKKLRYDQGRRNVGICFVRMELGIKRQFI